MSCLSIKRILFCQLNVKYTYKIHNKSSLSKEDRTRVTINILLNNKDLYVVL